jgi:small multidrug resistance pump
MELSFVILLVAIMFEMLGTSAMKETQGFTKLMPVFVMVPAYLMAMGLMSVAMKSIPVNVVYAVWSGLGTAGIATIGWLYFREPFTGWAVLGIAMIIGGIVILHTLGIPAASKASAVQGDASAATGESSPL